MALAIPFPDELVDALAVAVADRAWEMLEGRLRSDTPWLTTKEAIAYTKLGERTFERESAAGRIPSHSPEGVQVKLFHRDELDAMLGYPRAGQVRSLRRSRRAA